MYDICSPILSEDFFLLSLLAKIIITGIITFRVRRSRGEMYIGHGHLCMCLSVCLSLGAFAHNCTDPDVGSENGRGCPLVVHY